MRNYFRDEAKAGALVYGAIPQADSKKTDVMKEE